MHFGEYELSPSLISFHPYPQLVGKLFNAYPARLLQLVLPNLQPVPRVDQQFLRLPPTLGLPVQTRFRFGSVLKNLTLPGRAWTSVHYAKGTPSRHYDAPTACRQTGSGSLSLPLLGVLSPFLTVPGSLSVSRAFRPYGMGPF